MDSNGEPVDVDFYRSFWGLQRAFQAPYATMAPAPWSSAVKTIQAALKRFKQEGFAVASSSLPSAGTYAVCDGCQQRGVRFQCKRRVHSTPGPVPPFHSFAG